MSQTAVATAFSSWQHIHLRTHAPTMAKERLHAPCQRQKRMPPKDVKAPRNRFKLLVLNQSQRLGGYNGNSMPPPSAVTLVKSSKLLQVDLRLVVPKCPHLLSNRVPRLLMRSLCRPLAGGQGGMYLACQPKNSSVA